MLFSEDVIDKAYDLRDRVRRFVLSFGLMQREVTPCGRKVDLPRAHALMQLYEADEGLRISDLAGSLNIDISNVSRLCTTLVDEGYVERRPCPDDGRARRIHLTRKGRNEAAALDGASLTRFSSIIEHIPEQSQDQVMEALTVLNEAIEACENTQ